MYGLREPVYVLGDPEYWAMREPGYRAVRASVRYKSEPVYDI